MDEDGSDDRSARELKQDLRKDDKGQAWACRGVTTERKDGRKYRETGDDRAVLYSSTEYKKIRLHYFTDDYARWEAEHT